jgi:hypothetical protein
MQAIIWFLLNFLKLLTLQSYIIWIDLICDASITIAYLIHHLAYYCQTQPDNSYYCDS